MIFQISNALAKIPLAGRRMASAAEVVRAYLVQLRSARATSTADAPLSSQWAEIFAASPDLVGIDRTEPFRPGGILLFPIWGPVTAPSTKAVELILAHALRLRGNSVALMACQRTLPGCVVDPLGNHRGRLSRELRSAFTHGAASCFACVGGIREISRHSLVPILSMADYAHPGDLSEAESEVEDLAPSGYRAHWHAGVHVGEHAFASAIRATGRGTLEDKPLHNEIFRRQLVAAIVCARTTHRAFDALRPGQIGLTHGIYVDHGTVTEVAKVRGLPVTIYVRPYRQSTVMLCRGETYHKALITESNALWENRPLAVDERERLLNYILSRRRGTQDSLTYHPNPIEGRDRILAMLGLDASKPVAVAYTNVMWDAQLYHASSAFPDMLAWLHATIQHFAARPGLQLVIRVHPAEVKATKKSLQPVVDEIARRHPLLPANIKVVPPESDVSSYDLAEQACANIIYGTKMGLEIALMRRPVIVAGESFVRGKGFTYDATDPDGYIRLLGDITQLPPMSDAAYDRALRYGYHFYFKRQIDLPLFEERAGRVRLRFRSLLDLVPGEQPNLDAICRSFETGSEYLAP